jgi:hypothetical protein
MLKWRGFDLSSEEGARNRRRQDDDFCQAVRNAVYSGMETCSVGVSTEPGTKKPIFNYLPPD